MRTKSFENLFNYKNLSRDHKDHHNCLQSEEITITILLFHYILFSCIVLLENLFKCKPYLFYINQKLTYPPWKLGKLLFPCIVTYFLFINDLKRDLCWCRTFFYKAHSIITCILVIDLKIILILNSIASFMPNLFDSLMI